LPPAFACANDSHYRRSHTYAETVCTFAVLRISLLMPDAG